MASYRVRINNTTPAGDGTAHFDIEIQMLTDPGPPEVWQTVPLGHRTVVLQASAIKLITEDSGLTDTQKRNALRALLKQEAQNFGVDEADDAINQILALIPSGSWPVNINF